ncbi:MAG: AAA family ATPase [Micromonosporaceae bacterium]|nr:AAA family ATPase [Micromonosporaceae bacterium]
MPAIGPAVVVLTGIMAAGKSTVAQALAARLPRSAHVRGDVFRRMVVCGRREMTPEMAPEAVEQLWLRYRLSARVADEYASHGFTAVVQDIILGADLVPYLSLVATRPRYLVVLAPGTEAVAARERDRDKKGYGDWSVEAFDRELRLRTPRIGLWWDSTAETVEQTVDGILRRLPEAALPDELPIG